MKKIVLNTLIIFISSLTMAQESQKEIIEDVLVKSYVNSVFVEFNEDLIRKGFHPDFQFHFPMMGPNGRVLKKVVLDDWVKMLSNMKFGEIDYKVIEINLSGNAASSVSEIYQDGQKLYTDYMVWSKVEDNWVIMGKTYDMHKKMMRK